MCSSAITKFLSSDHPLFRLLRKLHLLPVPPAQLVDPKNSKYWLYDNIAFPDPQHPGKWSAEFITAMFSTDTPSKDVSKIVADLAEKLGLGNGDVEEKRMRERVQVFLDIVLENRLLELDWNSNDGTGERAVLKLGPTDGKGVAVNKVVLPGEWRDGMEVVSRDVHGKTEMTTRFFGKEGWAVVSDIDDTIKVSKVRDRIELLRHTFALPMQAVPGMSAFYQKLNARLNVPAWFYLSASPYNLFPFLTTFVKAHFPRGQLLLREMSWQELDSFIFSLTVGTQQYKEKELNILLNNLPDRKWVFIGDSTQTDPESYASVYRKYPERVKKIWIRKVVGVNLREEETLNSEDRWTKVFQGIPEGEVWRVFEDPAELEAELETLGKSE